VKEEKPAFQEYEGGVTEFGEYGGDDWDITMYALR
jgi:hypothetical protein